MTLGGWEVFFLEKITLQNITYKILQHIMMTIFPSSPSYSILYYIILYYTVLYYILLYRHQHDNNSQSLL